MKLKGIDDLLVAGRKPRRIHGDGVAGFLANIRARLWPTPASLPAIITADPAGAAARPPFPVEVFPDAVAAFVRRVSTALGCPPDFVGVGALVVAAAAIGAARSLRLKPGWDEVAGLYAVIVSPPATKKSPALRAVMLPIYDEQDRLHQSYQTAMRRYRADLAAFRRRAKKDDGTPVEEPEEPALRHLYASDTTVEALGAILDENRKGVLLFRDELTAWVRGLDQYKGRGTDRQFYLSAWSGEMAKVDRMSRHGQPLVVPHPYVAVLGGIQPDLLGELEAEGGREDGFLSRILFSYPLEVKAVGWVDDEITDADTAGWTTVVNRLLNLQADKPDGGTERPRRLRFDAGGRDAFKGWCDAQAAEMNAPDFPSQLMALDGKLRGYVARFAIVVHLLRVACGEAGTEQGEGEVDAEDVRRAILLANYFRRHAIVTYGRMKQTREDHQVDRFRDWMRRTKRRTCTIRDVCRAEVAGVKKASDAEKLFRAAADLGHGEVTSSRREARTFTMAS